MSRLAFYSESEHYYLRQKQTITDQHITKGAQSLHADVAPLVCEEDIFQPFVNHGVHLLQPWKENDTKNKFPENFQLDTFKSQPDTLLPAPSSL